jgi:zinc protease
VGDLDAADVNAAATRLLHPDQMTWVVVGDRSVIEQDVRALGFGDLRIVDADGNPAGSP